VGAGIVPGIGVGRVKQELQPSQLAAGHPSQSCVQAVSSLRMAT